MQQGLLVRMSVPRFSSQPTLNPKPICGASFAWPYGLLTAICLRIDFRCSKLGLSKKAVLLQHGDTTLKTVEHTKAWAWTRNAEPQHLNPITTL